MSSTTSHSLAARHRIPDSGRLYEPPADFEKLGEFVREVARNYRFHRGDYTSI